MEQQQAAKAKPEIVKTEMPKIEPKKAEPKVEPKVEAKAETKTAPQPAPGSRPGIIGVLPAAVAAAGSAIVPSASANERPVEKHAAAHRSGWAIQISDYDSETESTQKLRG